jgi:hypothetical protein
MMQHERRSSRRKPLEQLVYVSLPCDNGGIVLDVSEGGLGFHAVATVEAREPIHFQLSVRSGAGIKAVGEVVWKDETGKSGGLRFTHLSDGMRKQIGIWLGQPKVNSPIVTASTPATKIESAPGSMVDSASDEWNQRLSNNRKPSSSGPVTPLSIFPQEPRSAAGVGLAASQHPVSSRHSVATLALTIVLASVVAIGILSYLYRHEESESLIHLGEKIWAGSHLHPVIPTHTPLTSSRPDSTKATQ